MNSFRFYWPFLSFFILVVFQNAYAQTAQQEAEEMLDLVNDIRADRGIPPLRLNAELNQAAYDHSYDMASNNYFSHTGLNGSTFSQRAIAAGYTGSPRGENIAAGNSTVVNTFNQWVNSTGHLNNMLNSNSNEMGIGHAYYSGSMYTHYWTQIFGKGNDVLDVEDHLLANKIKVYPNPVKDIIHLQLPQNVIEVSLELKLVNSIGQIVYQKSIDRYQADVTLNIGHLPTGIYILYAQNTTVQKVIKV